MNLVEQERAKEIINSPTIDQDLLIQYFAHERRKLIEQCESDVESALDRSVECDCCEEMQWEVEGLERTIEKLNDKIEKLSPAGGM